MLTFQIGNPGKKAVPSCFDQGGLCSLSALFRVKFYVCMSKIRYPAILSSQVVSIPLQSLKPMGVVNFCATTDTLIDQDDIPHVLPGLHKTPLITYD